MAVEFIITDQTSIYSVNNGDEVFLTTGTQIRAENAFSFAANIGGTINGEYELYLAGDIFTEEDIFTHSFTATETSTILLTCLSRLLKRQPSSRPGTGLSRPQWMRTCQTPLSPSPMQGT